MFLDEDGESYIRIKYRNHHPELAGQDTNMLTKREEIIGFATRHKKSLIFYLIN